MKNTNKKSSIIWAVALILTGLVILLSSFNVITIKENIYFFVAIAIIGVVFHVACFVNNPKKYNLLAPGGMLLVFAALFIACEYSDKLNIDELWPILILAVSFGMLEQKVFSKGQQGNWASIIVISIIGLFFLIKNNLGFGIAFGALLIVIGILIVVRMAKNPPKSKTDTANETAQESSEAADEFDQL